DAERRTTIRSLPPVLHLQIMRFVYDPIIGEKRKVFTKLDFPDVLDMSSLIPELDKGRLRHGQGYWIGVLCIKGLV
ncbi:hypothetical protein SARC_17877, partial [Sphaeroforma arctica JP610]